MKTVFEQDELTSGRSWHTFPNRMIWAARYILIISAVFLFLGSTNGQINDICSENGNNPSLDSPFAHVQYVYGRVVLQGFDSAAKLPNVTVILVENQNSNRYRIDRSGNFCFRVRTSGGTLIIEVNGIEAARRALPAVSAAQQREDFEIAPAQTAKAAAPTVVSTKFLYPPNAKTIELYKKAGESEANNEPKKTISFLKEIVAIDPKDFIAWAKLGALYFAQESFADADSAFKKSLELRIDYTPAWVNVGKMRMVQKQYGAAIEIFNHALELEPNSAKVYRLLGETYLQAKQGSLGADALNKAIELDPTGMADCHLLLGHLYELAKANKMAAKEYQAYLAKVPNYKDKKKLEEFIEKNPQ